MCLLFGLLHLSFPSPAAKGLSMSRTHQEDLMMRSVIDLSTRFIYCTLLYVVIQCHNMENEQVYHLLVCPPIAFSSLSHKARKELAPMAKVFSGVVGNVETGGSEVNSWQLVVEKYRFAPFFFSLTFCFLFDSCSSQVTFCFWGFRPIEELPFLLYLRHTQLQLTKLLIQFSISILVTNTGGQKQYCHNALKI